MDDFFLKLPLSSYIQRLSDAQRQAAGFAINKKMTNADFIDWIKSPMQCWHKRHQHFNEHFYDYLFDELRCLKHEIVWDKQALRVIFNEHLSTVMNRHEKELYHLLNLLNKNAFREIKTTASSFTMPRCCWMPWSGKHFKSVS